MTDSRFRPGPSFRLAPLVVLATLSLAMSASTATAASAAPLAYTANYTSNSVSVIDTATNTVVGAPIPVGDGPYSIALTPDGRRALVANAGEKSVSVIDTATRQTIGEPIHVGEAPTTIAVAPNGRTAYVTDEESGEVTAIDPQTATVIGSKAGTVKPYGVAVAPDGNSVWVTDLADDEVWVLDLQTLEPIGAPIAVGKEPYVIAFAPNGKTAYVADDGSEEVSAIDTTTRAVTSLAVGDEPWGLALTPDGSKLFVSNFGEETVTVIATETGAVTRKIAVGNHPYELGMSPDGKVVYLAQFGADNVLAIDTATESVVGSPIELAGLGPWQVVVAPDQSPTAAFTAPSGVSGTPTTFDGSASTDPDGSIVSWGWSFGDGAAATGKTVAHTYSAAGTYSARLSVVDNEGCGEEQVFTGRTALCSGGASAVAHRLTVTAPPVATPPTPAPTPAPVTVSPSNRLRFGRLVHDRHNGTVRLQVTLPAAGSVLLTGPKVHLVRRKIAAAGTLWLTIHARVKLNKELKKTLRAKVDFRVSFTPTGGTTALKARSIVLQRSSRRT